MPATMSAAEQALWATFEPLVQQMIDRSSGPRLDLSTPATLLLDSTEVADMASYNGATITKAWREGRLPSVDLSLDHSGRVRRLFAGWLPHVEPMLAGMAIRLADSPQRLWVIERSWSVSAAAVLMGCSPSHLRKLITAGRVGAWHMPTDGNWHVAGAELAQVLAVMERAEVIRWNRIIDSRRAA